MARYGNFHVPCHMRWVGIAVFEKTLGNGTASMRTENTWWEVKQSFPRTGISKDLFEAIYGDGPLGNIIKHIADLYEERKILPLVFKVA